MSQSNKPDPKPREIHFTIDGEHYTTTEDQLTAGQILALAGKDAEEFYVSERHGRETTEYRNATDVVPIKNGTKLLTVFTGKATVS